MGHPARHIECPTQLKGRRSIHAGIAFTLGTFCNMDPQFWIILQSRYDLHLVQFQRARSIRAGVPPLVS
jgi:plasmid maintenance system antidote protein VapI